MLGYLTSVSNTIKDTRGPRKHGSVDVVKLSITGGILSVCLGFSVLNFIFFSTFWNQPIWGVWRYGFYRSNFIGRLLQTARGVSLHPWVPYHPNFFPYTLTFLSPSLFYLPEYRCSVSGTIFPSLYSLSTPQTVQPFSYLSIVTLLSLSLHVSSPHFTSLRIKQITSHQMRY